MQVNIPDTLDDELVEQINDELARSFGDVRIETRVIVFALHQLGKVKLLDIFGTSLNLGANLFPSCKYQIRAKVVPLAPDSIDWSHVAPNLNYMARDANGRVYLFERAPHVYDKRWDAEGGLVSAAYFGSFVRGTVDWKDSLVERPE